MQREEAYHWLLLGERRQHILLSLKQPMTARQLSKVTGLSLKATSKVVRELSAHGFVSCLNPSSRRSRLYWLSPLFVLSPDSWTETDGRVGLPRLDESGNETAPTPRRAPPRSCRGVGEADGRRHDVQMAVSGCSSDSKERWTFRWKEHGKEADGSSRLGRRKADGSGSSIHLRPSSVDTPEAGEGCVSRWPRKIASILSSSSTVFCIS